MSALTLTAIAGGANLDMADPVNLYQPIFTVPTLEAEAVVFALTASLVPLGKVGCLILTVTIKADVTLTAVRAPSASAAPRGGTKSFWFALGAATTHYANTAIVWAATASGA